MPLGIFEKKKPQQPLQGGASASQERDLKGQTLLVGRHVVTVERKLAEGGFAIVYIVRCNRSNRLFALKRQFVNDQKQLDACKREIQIIKSLSEHKNMVTYVDSSISQAGEGVFECMLLTQYYRYSVLALMNDRLLKGKALSVQEILRIFCDVCEAVSRLHHSQTPVIHRDLKVENILIDDRGTFVLCDFGSATTKVLSTQKQSHSVVEEEILKYTTLSYRAPEMVDLYSAKPITTKSDIWALGVMLYKLCYFSLPFGESALAIQNGSFSFPDQSDYFPELKALIRYLLEPDCDKRPDIYQASSIAFRLSGRKCPVPNLNNVGVPRVSELLHLLAIHNQRTNERTSESPPSHIGTAEGVSSTTTVAPRLRPKGSTPSARLPLPQKSATPWKQPPLSSDTSSLPSTATPPPDSARVVESSSNPDLSSGSGGSSRLTPSQSLHSALNNSTERIVLPPVVRPQDLGFTDLEDPGKLIFPESPFHPLEPPEGPLVSLSPPEDEEKEMGSMGSGAPSQSAPQLPPPPPGLLDSPCTPVRSHRRNVSDTSAVFGGGDARRSAFKPYRSSQPDVNAVGEAVKKQELLEMSLMGPDVGLPLSASTSPSGVAGLGHSSCQNEQRTHSATDMGPGTNSDSWNPFSNAPGFERRKQSQMDDLSFGKSFDALPRSSKRRGSVSSTSNVKSSESLVMTINEKDPFGAAPFNPPSRGSSAASAKKDRIKDHQGQKQMTQGVTEEIKSEAPKQPEGSQQQSALSTLASTIKHTNRYRKLIDADEEPEGPRETTPEATDRTTADRLEVPTDDRDSDSVGSATDLQKRMELNAPEEPQNFRTTKRSMFQLTSTDDSTGVPSEPEEDGVGHEEQEQNITYEHFDAESSDSHGEGVDRMLEGEQEEGSLSEGHWDEHGKDVSADYHPYFLNSETVDGLGHRPLLEDDELDEKNHSLPKFHPESLELNVLKLSSDAAKSTSARISLDEEIQSPQSNDTLCNVALSSPEAATPSVDSGAQESTKKNIENVSIEVSVKESFPPEPVVISIPSPVRTKKWEKDVQIPCGADPASNSFPATDAFGAVPLQTVVRVGSPPSVHSPSSTASSVHMSPPTTKMVPVVQQQPRPSGILVKKTPSPAAVKRSGARAQPMETIGSSSGDEDELYLSGGSRSSSKKGPSRRKTRSKGGPGRHRNVVDDGGEDELVSGSPPEPSPSTPNFPVNPAIPKRKSKEKKSKTGGEVLDAAFVNTSFQLEDADSFCPPSPSVAS